MLVFNIMAKAKTPLTGKDREIVDAPEIMCEHEELAPSPRIVAYGMKFHDAQVLVRTINEQLDQRDITGFDVYYSYDARNIENAFFGRGRKPKQPEQLAAAAGALALPGSSSKVSSEVTKAKDGSLSLPEEETAPERDTIPMGVIIFPEMRQYTPEGAGMTIDTPKERIEELCNRFGVPFIYASINPEEQAGLGQRVAELIPAPRELPPTT